ncbi:hypothetical protein ACWKSP_22190 [Micromonosporaceae bacterium Da 78-11]
MATNAWDVAKPLRDSSPWHRWKRARVCRAHRGAGGHHGDDAGDDRSTLAHHGQAEHGAPDYRTADDGAAHHRQAEDDRAEAGNEEAAAETHHRAARRRVLRQLHRRP